MVCVALSAGHNWCVGHLYRLVVASGCSRVGASVLIGDASRLSSSCLSARRWCWCWWVGIKGTTQVAGSLLSLQFSRLLSRLQNLSLLYPGIDLIKDQDLVIWLGSLQEYMKIAVKLVFFCRISLES